MEINQELIDELVPKWTEIGLSTEKMDKEKCYGLIEEIYRNVDMDPPEFYFYAPSPVDAIKMHSALNLLGYKAVCEADDPQQLVEDTAREKIGKVEFNNQICYGNHEASILSFYEYFIREGTVEDIDNIKPFIELAHVAGWWIPTPKAVILIERPSVIKLDENGLTHCQDGPAIKYDNTDFEVYIWHGVRIPDEWIRDPGALTAEIALTWENVEQRRCACEILGWANILKELDARVIDENPDPTIGTLLEVDLPELGTERFLKVLCDTGREFAIPVEPSVQTALEAQASTWGESPDEFIPPEVQS